MILGKRALLLHHASHFLNAATPSLPPSAQPRQPAPIPVALPSTNEQSHHGTQASPKQISAIFATGKTTSYTAEQMKQWVKGQFSKAVNDVSSPKRPHSSPP